MKRLLIPLAAVGLSAAVLAPPANAAPNWATDNLLPKPADAYGAAAFWLDSNGAALKKATQYNLDSKQVPKLVSSGSKGAPDGKPGMTGPTTTAKAERLEERQPAQDHRQGLLPRLEGPVPLVLGHLDPVA